MVSSLCTKDLRKGEGGRLKRGRTRPPTVGEFRGTHFAQLDTTSQWGVLPLGAPYHTINIASRYLSSWAFAHLPSMALRCSASILPRTNVHVKLRSYARSHGISELVEGIHVFRGVCPKMGRHRWGLKISMSETNMQRASALVQGTVDKIQMARHGKKTIMLSPIPSLATHCRNSATG